MNNMTNTAKYVSVTIPNGQTTSGEVSCELVTSGGYQLHAIEFPAAMTGTAVTFTASRSSGGTFGSVRNVGGSAAYSITVTASAIVPVDWQVFSTLPYVKLVSGSAEGADRTIVVHLRRHGQ